MDFKRWSKRLKKIKRLRNEIVPPLGMGGTICSDDDLKAVERFALALIGGDENGKN